MVHALAQLQPWFRASRNFEIHRDKKALGGSLVGFRRAALFDAALVGQEPHERSHGGIVRPADQRRRLPLLRHQAGHDQAVQVMRKRGSGDAEALLQAADRKPAMARSDQRPIDLKPGRTPQRLELGGCTLDLHGEQDRGLCGRPSTVFPEYSKLSPQRDKGWGLR
jgi:hypothetical protein